MKRITAISLLTIAGLASSGIALAQDRVVEAKVPFNFSVGNKLLPAGTYRVTQSSSNLVLVQDGERNNAAMSTTYSSSGSTGPGKLVFDKYGDRYFLHAVLSERAGINVDFPTSRSEKQALLREEALLHGHDEVQIATR